MPNSRTEALRLAVHEVGVFAGSVPGGRVMAAGAGWAWLRDGGRVVHLSGRRGPRGPLTATVDRVPVLRPGDRVSLDLSRARTWRTPPPPAPADAERVAAACEAVRPHAWNDPRAWALGEGDLAAGAATLAGRGPGLTPAGDDVLAGFVLARGALGGDAARGALASVVAAGRHGGEPARSLLRAAVRGEAFDPAAVMLACLLSADGPSIAPSVRRLAALGSTTGRAMLTGIVRGIASAPAVSA